MDAERAHALGLSLLDAFHEVVLDAYVERDELDVMISYRLGRQHALPESRTFHTCVRKLILAAKSEGWLHELINAVVTDRPRNNKVKDWVRAADEPSASALPPQGQQLVDTAYFDLESVRRAVARATRTAPKGGVISFGIANAESIFIRKLTDWLSSFLGETQVKEPLILRPEYATVATRLMHISRYHRDLQTANVLCAVYVDGTPVHTVAEFWQGVRTSFAGVARSLVLVFAGAPNAGFPAGVTVLPPPSFDIDDVDVWTHEVVRRKGWPTELATAWTDRLHRDSWAGNRLDVRLLYEAMDRTIQDARFDAAAFRRQLEEGAGSAFATQA